MKVAFLFSGQLRDLPVDLFKKSLINLTSDLDYSIFSYCWDEKGKSLNHKSQSADLTSIENVDEYIKLIFNDFNLVNYGHESFKEFKSNLKKEYKDILKSKNYHYGTINSLPQVYTIYKSYKLCETSGQNFDLIFRCRFDSIFIHPFKLFPLKKILDSEKLFNINFGRAYYPKRVYDIFFGGSNKSMYFLSNIWFDFPKLVSNKFNNGLDKRDCCRILYLGAYLKNVKVQSFNSRICDIYRNNNFDYEKYLLSSHLVKIQPNKSSLNNLKFIAYWFFKERKIKFIQLLIPLMKFLFYLPASYLKRLIYIFRNYQNFF